MEVEIPKYLYNKPDGYYADNVIKNRDEIINGLKSDASSFKNRLDYFSRFKPLNTDKVYMFSTNSPIKGEIKFVPKKFSVIDIQGELYKALTCDIIFKNLILMGKDDVKLWKEFFNNPDTQELKTVFGKQLKSSMGVWDEEFKKIAVLIGMDDYELRIDNVIFEYDE